MFQVNRNKEYVQTSEGMCAFLALFSPLCVKVIKGVEFHIHGTWNRSGILDKLIAKFGIFIKVQFSRIWEIVQLKIIDIGGTKYCRDTIAYSAVPQFQSSCEALACPREPQSHSTLWTYWSRPWSLETNLRQTPCSTGDETCS